MCISHSSRLLALRHAVNGKFFPSASRQTRSAYTISTQIPLPPDHITTLSCDAKSLGEYTSARWVWNEKEQLRRRHVSFDVAELAKVASKAVGSDLGMDLTKLPEGYFNKVFLMAMDDGKEVIAKIPNPNAGRPHLTIASEVATMDYVSYLCQPSTFPLACFLICFSGSKCSQDSYSKSLRLEFLSSRQSGRSRVHSHGTNRRSCAGRGLG
jgi:hypothetical protein